MFSYFSGWDNQPSNMFGWRKMKKVLKAETPVSSTCSLKPMSTLNQSLTECPNFNFFGLAPGAVLALNSLNKAFAGMITPVTSVVGDITWNSKWLLHYFVVSCHFLIIFPSFSRCIRICQGPKPLTKGIYFCRETGDFTNSNRKFTSQHEIYYQSLI